MKTYRPLAPPPAPPLHHLCNLQRLPLPSAQELVVQVCGHPFIKKINVSVYIPRGNNETDVTVTKIEPITVVISPIQVLIGQNHTPGAMWQMWHFLCSGLLSFGVNGFAPMVKQKQKLWCNIDRIEKCKTVSCGTGKKYFVHLVDGTKPLWVLAKDLSSGVSVFYDEKQSTPKKAKALVDRGYVQSPAAKRSLFGANQPAAKKSTQDPLKLLKRNTRWIVDADHWVSQLNKVG